MWWTFHVRKLELFFKEIGQQHAFDTPGIFLATANQLIPKLNWRLSMHLIRQYQ